jgi:hypothetical protein
MHPRRTWVVRARGRWKQLAAASAVLSRNHWVQRLLYGIAGTAFGVALWWLSNYLANTPASEVDWSTVACGAVGAIHGVILRELLPVGIWDLPTKVAALGLVPSWMFLIVVVRLRLWEGVKLQYKGVEELPNWSLYPVWFFILACATRLTWHPFVAAWQAMPARGLIVRADTNSESTGGQARGDRNDLSPADHWRAAVVADDEQERLRAYFSQWAKRWRRGLIPAALVTSGVLMWFDNVQQWKVYERESVPASPVCIVGCPLKIDKTNACRCRSSDEGDCEALSKCEARDQICTCPTGESTCNNVWVPGLDCDFSVAHLVDATRRGSLKRLFMIMCTLEVGLTALATLSFLQLVLHTTAFWCCAASERIRLGACSYQVRMNPYSPNNEFGLEGWNQVLNNVYWMLSPALLIAIVSKSTLDDPENYRGQMLMRHLVPLVVALPMILSIIARQVLLERVWVEADALLRPPKDANTAHLDVIEHYLGRLHAQRIWPLTENWASKAGLALAFLLLSVLLGIEAFRALI